MEYRVAWNINGTEGHGQPIDLSTAESHVQKGRQDYGWSPHWVEYNHDERWMRKFVRQDNHPNPEPIYKEPDNDG